MSRKPRPKIMVDFFPLSRLKKLHSEGTPPHWRAFHELPILHVPEHMSLEYERSDGTGDLGGIHIESLGGGRGPDKDLPLLAAGRNALPHFIAAIEAAFALESAMHDEPMLANLTRALNVFRERKVSAMARKGESNMNADDPSVSREVIGGGL